MWASETAAWREAGLCGARAFGWSVAGGAPVVDLRERQVCRGAEVLLLALVGVRAVEVVEAPLGEVLLDVGRQERLLLRRAIVEALPLRAR